MKSIFSLLLLAFFIQNILSASDYDITIKEFLSEMNECKPNDPQIGSYFAFYLKIDASGFQKETEWKLQLDGQYAYADCFVYPEPAEDQKIACTVNTRNFPLKGAKLPGTYTHYDSRYGFTVTGWEKVANKVILSTSCYPTYSYSFIPSKTQHEVVCDASGYNQVTIYGLFEKATQPESVRRLSSDEDLVFSPYIIVDGNAVTVNCAIKRDGSVNSSEDAMVCAIKGNSYFQFFATTAIEEVEKTIVLVEDSQRMGLIKCASSFLKLGSILLASLLLL